MWLTMSPPRSARRRSQRLVRVGPRGDELSVSQIWQAITQANLQAAR
jgi:hypothetical protein